jgi:hypothetical protein
MRAKPACCSVSHKRRERHLLDSCLGGLEAGAGPRPDLLASGGNGVLCVSADALSSDVRDVVALNAATRQDTVELQTGGAGYSAPACLPRTGREGGRLCL